MRDKTRDDFDKELRKKARERFALAERLEAEYMRSLRMLTRQIDHIVKSMAPGGVVKNSIELQTVLRSYSKAIEPWARSVAERMVRRIEMKDENAWIKLGNDIGRSVQEELNEAPTGLFLRKILEENVHLITSLPLDAAQRVHELTLEATVTSRRAEEIQKDILATGEVSLSRARLIARTEVARTASGLTQARALHVGCTHYVWRTSRDGTVRESHRKMDGKIIAWADAPLLEDGTRTHAGQIYNCRCYPEPILTD